MSAVTITVRVPLAVRPQRGRKTVVRADGANATVGMSTRADPAVVKALARAFRWNRMLEEGRYASISDIAAAEKIDRGYVGNVLRLTLLAPGIVEAILGDGAGGISLPRLLEPFPLEWDVQRPMLVSASPNIAGCSANNSWQQSELD
jgi:hypothetical protein